LTEVNRLESRKESTILDWIQNAPLFVGIDASLTTFISYTGGRKNYNINIYLWTIRLSIRNL